MLSMAGRLLTEDAFAPETADDTTANSDAWKQTLAHFAKSA